MIDELPPRMIGKMMMGMGDDVTRKQWRTAQGVLVEMNREADNRNVSFNVRIVRRKKDRHG